MQSPFAPNTVVFNTMFPLLVFADDYLVSDRPEGKRERNKKQKKYNLPCMKKLSYENVFRLELVQTEKGRRSCDFWLDWLCLRQLAARRIIRTYRKYRSILLRRKFVKLASHSKRLNDRLVFMLLLGLDNSFLGYDNVKNIVQFLS